MSIHSLLKQNTLTCKEHESEPTLNSAESISVAVISCQLSRIKNTTIYS